MAPVGIALGRCGPCRDVVVEETVTDRLLERLPQDRVGVVHGPWGQRATSASALVQEVHVAQVALVGGGFADHAVAEQWAEFAVDPVVGGAVGGGGLDPGAQQGGGVRGQVSVRPAGPWTGDWSTGADSTSWTAAGSTGSSLNPATAGCWSGVGRMWLRCWNAAAVETHARRGVLLRVHPQRCIALAQR